MFMRISYLYPGAGLPGSKMALDAEAVVRYAQPQDKISSLCHNFNDLKTPQISEPAV